MIEIKCSGHDAGQMAQVGFIGRLPMKLKASDRCVLEWRFRLSAEFRRECYRGLPQPREFLKR
jgi:hypothetical protein